MPTLEGKATFSNVLVEVPQADVNAFCTRPHETHLPTDLVFPDQAAVDAACTKMHIIEDYRPAAYVPMQPAPETISYCLGRLLAAGIRTDHRPANAQAIGTYATPQQISTFQASMHWGGPSAASETWRRTITGTLPCPMDTLTLVRYFAHMYGLDERWFLAQLWQESGHNWNAGGDYVTGLENEGILFGLGTWNRRRADGQIEYAQSVGPAQLKYRYHGKNVWPLARDSFAFNVQYLASHLRSVMNRTVSYLLQRTPVTGYPTYADAHPDQLMMGAIGQWFSGSFFDQAAIDYIDDVTDKYNAQPWLSIAPALAAEAITPRERPEWDDEAAAHYGAA